MAIPFMGKRPPKQIAKLPAPGEVFTPRSANVTAMYVERPALEDALSGLFDSNEVRYLYGHSGSGKTWLYKSVFRRNDVYFYDIPLQGLTEGVSFDDLIRQHLGILNGRIETSTIDAKAVQGNIGGIGGGVGTSTKSRPFERSPLDMLLAKMRELAGDRRAVLVFENVERGARRPDVLGALTNIIMSVDQTSFAAHDVRVLLVGTVKDLVNRISELPDSAPIRSRLVVLPEVSRLSNNEAKRLVEHGLFDLLQLEPLLDQTRLVNRILQRTDRLPLHIHAYCLELARSAMSRSRQIDQVAENGGFQRWVSSKVAQYVDGVFAHMNSKDTALKVRTRVLYCIANAQLSEFRPLDVKNMMDQEWPDLDPKNASIAGALNELASEVAKTKDRLDPILERVTRANVNHYRFIDPAYKIAAKIGLKKNAMGEVEREELLGEI
jgi:hypothetical protein